MEHKFKVGDIVRCPLTSMVYKIKKVYLDSFDSEWWYQVDILDVGRAEHYRIGLETFPIYSCGHDELANGYMAAKQFDSDLEDLLDE